VERAEDSISECGRIAVDSDPQRVDLELFNHSAQDIQGCLKDATLQCLVM